MENNQSKLEKTIYYIAGAGRSGSTLFDITLGNVGNHRSLGELIFFVENGLLQNEYCSCGDRVQDCIFWKEVHHKWNIKKRLSIEVFQKTQKELLRNKNTIKNIYYSFFSKPLHRQYYQDLQALYEVLFEVSQQPILIDSSKNVQYLLVLRKLGYSIKVLHLTRSFSGVLNSTKKEFKKDPAAGLERDMKPQSFKYSLAIWLIDNTLAWLFSMGKSYQRIKYEDLIASPSKTIKKFIDLSDDESNLLENRGPLFAEHLVAGNKLRISKEIYIEQMNSNKWNNNVNKHEKMLAHAIDTILNLIR